METRRNKGRARLPVKRDGRCKTLLPAPRIPREGSHPAWAETRARGSGRGRLPERELGPGPPGRARLSKLPGQEQG